MLYEINYLVLQSKTSDLEEIRKEVKKIFDSFGLKITAEREYLKRKLAYEIKHERFGFFTVLRFETEEKEKVQEIKKNLNINENIARYIIVKADELPSMEEQKQKEKSLKNKETLKKEEIEKALIEDKKEEFQEKKEKISKIDEPTEEETIEETKEEILETEETKEKIKEESPTEDKEKEKKDDEDEKNSLDDLDKKLDEILNL